MSPANRTVLVSVLSCLTVACSSSSTGPTVPNVVGTWNATKAEFIRVANPATKLELISAGASVKAVFAADNTFTLTASLPGTQPDVSTGTYTVTTSTLTLNITSNTPAENITFTLSMSGNTMSLTGGTAPFNFGNGDEAATVNLTLTKQ
jgi:hypothetical protein